MLDPLSRIESDYSIPTAERRLATQVEGEIFSKS
jgi:hypothetical protein